LFIYFTFEYFSNLSILYDKLKELQFYGCIIYTIYKLSIRCHHDCKVFKTVYNTYNSIVQTTEEPEQKVAPEKKIEEPEKKIAEPEKKVETDLEMKKKQQQLVEDFEEMKKKIESLAQAETKKKK
jgi:hypothetical protein